MKLPVLWLLRLWLTEDIPEHLRKDGRFLLAVSVLLDLLSRRWPVKYIHFGILALEPRPIFTIALLAVATYVLLVAFGLRVARHLAIVASKALEDDSEGRSTHDIEVRMSKRFAALHRLAYPIMVTDFFVAAVFPAIVAIVVLVV